MVYVSAMSDALVETGLTGLTVTEPVTPSLPLPTARPQMPAGLPVKFSTENAYALARKVAMELGPIQIILAEAGISKEMYEWLLAEPFYAEALKRAMEEWHDIKSTPQRLVLKTAAVLEDSLLVVGARLSNKTEPLASVAQMTKVYADITGLNKQATSNAPQERVSISIDFGADARLVVEKTIEGRAPPADDKVVGDTDTIQSQPERPRPLPPLPLDSPKTGS